MINIYSVLTALQYVVYKIIRACTSVIVMSE